MSDDNESPLGDVLPITTFGEAQEKLCFLNTNHHCQLAKCMAWRTVVEYDYTNDPKKEEPIFEQHARTVYNGERGARIPSGDVGFYMRQQYDVIYEDVEIEWEKIKIDGKTIYRRPRKEEDRLGYCLKLAE